MTKRKTVGQEAINASRDPTKYDSLEVGHALCDDILGQLWAAIDLHRNIIDEPEFCVVMILADDPLIKGVMRRKFYCWPYLPSPRPRQACFLYTKSNDCLKRLWVMPDAATMATLSEMITVAQQWKTMKGWSDAFFDGQFWQHIRDQHKISLLSESEYLNANREKLIQAGCKEIHTPIANPFDFSKITTNKVVNSDNLSLKK